MVDVVLVTLGVAMALVAFLVATTYGHQVSFERDCVAVAGHLYETADAKLCLSADGRVLEVRP